MPTTTYEPSILKPQKDGTFFSNPITNELFNRRVLMLDTEVDKASCSSLIKAMLVLEAEDPKAEITLIINSPGGSVYDGLALIDVMQDISCPVHTISTGLVASMAAVILASGDKRSVHKNSFVLIHQLMGGGGISQQSDIEISAQQAARLRGKLDEILAAKSSLSAEEFHKLTERDCWCDAERALELGLVDEIIVG